MQDEIKVGSELYKVYNDSRVGRNGPVVVKSIGRSWITIDGHRSERFDRQTLRSERGGSRLYPTKEAHDAERNRGAAWLTLRRLTDRSFAPEHVTTEDIKAAIGLLVAKQQAGAGE